MSSHRGLDVALATLCIGLIMTFVACILILVVNVALPDAHTVGNRVMEEPEPFPIPRSVVAYGRCRRVVGTGFGDCIARYSGRIRDAYLGTFTPALIAAACGLLLFVMLGTAHARACSPRHSVELLP